MYLKDYLKDEFKIASGTRPSVVLMIFERRVLRGSDAAGVSTASLLMTYILVLGSSSGN